MKIIKNTIINPNNIHIIIQPIHNNFPIIALNWNNLEKQQTPFELLPGYIKK